MRIEIFPLVTMKPPVHSKKVPNSEQSVDTTFASLLAQSMAGTVVDMSERKQISRKRNM
ncbi:hypothetical protein [Paenibacillus sp. RU26A]|uniref:hypothetical protein n=1 Tax=Paenibacillus sp. RU26A TaxID=1907393 RepID=UPI0009CD346E|nr:hypothetical protein [Paenibacillus sp. RU26A]SLK16761.1 hypothetical protein SAMN06272722_110242 [Paenibacillus sp. RU5A]SOC74458.1 hypothetical protein SAMN05880581_110242 [Paenibacillus sp. RU26A]SOC76646.1 hypothetical protein SAMN05880586_110242 [Paenibacillus sp. RU5M]